MTTVIAAAVILASVSPSLAHALQLDFASVAAGQGWRLLSGHLTHHDRQHLFWDLLMFIVLGAACERQHPRLFGTVFVLMAIGISAAVMARCADVSASRGLSGIDTGLFVWFIADQVRHSLGDRDPRFACLWMATGTLLIGKLLFESVTGEVLFVDADGFKPLIEAHLSGAAFGALVAGGSIVTERVKHRRRGSWGKTGAGKRSSHSGRHRGNAWPIFADACRARAERRST